MEASRNHMFDYIIAGAGASGLMMAYRMSQNPWFRDKKILLLDKEVRSGNDRTWCYWEKGSGEWDDLLTTSWPYVSFRSPHFSKEGDIAPYQYKMLRSKALYSHLNKAIEENPAITRCLTNIHSVASSKKCGIIHTTEGDFMGHLVISSLFPQPVVEQQSEFPYLKQHFVGWFVRTKTPVFNPSCPVFMDFTVAQRGNTRFMYVLPTSETEALVEYTLFSDTLLPKDEYEEEIRQYLHKSGVSDYDILEVEIGNIPMTSYPFESHNSSHVVHIGSAGGWTKASTGFTFSRICDFSKRLTDYIAEGKRIEKFCVCSRYSLYDLIFLDVLYRKNDLGATIFSTMFQRNTFAGVLTFLDERGSLWTDLLIIIRSKPRLEFVKSVFGNLKSITRVLFS